MTPLAAPALALPAAKEAATTAGKFWRGFLEAAGKPAIVTREVRQGRKVLYESSYVFGFEKTRERGLPAPPDATGKGTRIRTREMKVARWEVAAAALAIGGGALWRSGWRPSWPWNVSAWWNNFHDFMTNGVTWRKATPQEAATLKQVVTTETQTFNTAASTAYTAEQTFANYKGPVRKIGGF